MHASPPEIGSTRAMLAEMVPDASPAQRTALAATIGALKASAKVSPVPIAFAVRKLFEQTGAETTATLRRHAPIDVVVWPDEPYGERPEEVADIFVPARSAGPGVQLPTVVWVHGGGFVGGSKEQLAGWFRILADAGFCVVAPRYSLAPRAHHPTPVRQVVAVLDHLRRDPVRLHVDPTRLVIAGDSAGAHIAAQAALVVTDPRFARRLGVRTTIDPAHLRATVLCCGIYDVAAMDDPTSPFGPFFDAVMWAYAGTRRWRLDQAFTLGTSLPGHVTAAFPPAFVTVGNADPLAPQSDELVGALEAAGVVHDALRFPGDHQPALEHEYQFDLDLDDARLALDRMVAFVRAHTG
ncbi:alpha/beta hydrolase [Rhabdothermincola salaria]|uniref:alpha/beta hydrolase n=1 Tax=Rhabdothermincola salaria TaxID=2903142 RepID=UPI001E3023E6|nr:alpha/beta hydrolase [Rhabdothermincola salaria]MCD9623968.1 alpha/beta hydrolase [Rhabdothermincola salaria]